MTAGPTRPLSEPSPSVGLPTKGVRGPDEVRRATVPLGLAPGLRFRMDASRHVHVDTPLGGVVDAGPHGLALLGLFAEPRDLESAMAALSSLPEPRPERMPAVATITALVSAGAIVVNDADVATGPRFGWSDPAEHARMIDDTRRTDSFVAAIQGTVRGDDIVLDIGTGSGILAIAAARAGARHVFAIEASDIAATAAAAFEANGVADRVTLIEGWSTQIELPERATVLVTETIGAEPLEEDILRTVLDARRRLLTDDARLVPRSLSLRARAVSIPDLERWASRVDPTSVAAWRQRYGVDMRVLWEARRREPLHWPVDSVSAATWEQLGPEVVLTDIDLATLDVALVDARTELVIDGPGRVDAILVTFATRLSDSITLVAEPRRDEWSSWDSSVWFLPDAIEVRERSTLQLGYHFGLAGRPDGLAVVAAG